MKKLLLLVCLTNVFVGCAQSQQEPASLFPDQIPKLKTISNAVDSNRDGQLSTQEILGAPAAIRALDRNGDGKVDQQEMGAFEKFLPMIRTDNIVKVIEANGDIEISAEEIKNASVALKHLDADGDWQVSVQEMTIGQSVGPAFNTRGMSMEVWNLFRGYTKELSGPLPPGVDGRAAEGYLLVHEAGDGPQAQVSNATYLLDGKGNKVHEWPHPGYSPEATVAYLLPNGQLLRAVSLHHWTQDKRFPVGSHSSIELVSWEGKALWTFTMSQPEKYSFHHDLDYLPNGNILAIRYTAFTKEEAMVMGWDPSQAKKAMHAFDKKGSGMVWMDAILELKPNLDDGSTEIVWQWNSWDHLVQDTYPDKKNFGDIANPSKIHVNYLDYDQDVPYNKGQFFHLNTVDYNADLDMIVLSSPTFGEVWFIDHSTSTAQAASSKGGRHNSGGDLLYRWGNDEAFGKGNRDQSILYWQHDIQWIDEGLPGAGNMLVYNNGNRRTIDGKYARESNSRGFGNAYSDILEVKMPMNDDGSFDWDTDAQVVWSWEAENKSDYYSPFMSGAQRLPNGNTIFCRAFDKYITEVTPGGEKVLDFTPAGWGRLHRIYKYPTDFPGLRFNDN